MSENTTVGLDLAKRVVRVARLNGGGALTASAVAAIVVDASQVLCGRQLAAWPGLTPRQYATGGKAHLGHITGRGDTHAAVS